MNGSQDTHRHSECRRLEKRDFSTLFQYLVKFIEYQPDFLFRKMLHYTQVLDSIVAGIWDRIFGRFCWPTPMADTTE
jgi:hypothetical protein